MGFFWIKQTKMDSNIIGISKTASQSSDNTSSSSIYMDEVEVVDSLLLSGDEGLILARKSRETAIKTFIGDSNALLIKNRKRNFKSFAGKIGQSRSIGQTSFKGYQGVRITFRPINGGIFQINGIGILSDAEEEIIISNEYGEEIQRLDIPVSSTSSQITTIQPIDIDMSANREIYILFKPKGTIQQNKVNCECGRFKPNYDISKPYYYDKHFGSDEWANYSMVGGINVVDMESLSKLSDQATNFMNGILLDVKFTCSITSIMENHSTDFDSDPLSMAVALAVLYKAAELCIDGILQSRDINMQILVNAENINNITEELQKKYAEKLMYLTTNADITINDCLCEDTKTESGSTLSISTQTMYS